LSDLISKEQSKLDTINSKEVKETKFNDNTLFLPNQPYGKKSKISDLRKLDNE
jgi:hypothetical protein